MDCFPTVPIGVDTDKWIHFQYRNNQMFFTSKQITVTSKWILLVVTSKWILLVGNRLWIKKIKDGKEWLRL